MTATLSQSQADLPRLVELASQGEDVLITVEGLTKARLTRATPVPTTEYDPAAWLAELEELDRLCDTGRQTMRSENILNDLREERG